MSSEQTQTTENQNQKYMTWPEIKAAMDKGERISLAHIDPKYHLPKMKAPDGSEIPWAENAATYHHIMEHAINGVRNDYEEPIRKKEQEEERRKMEQYYKQQKDKEKRDAGYRSKLPQQQYQMIRSGKHLRCSCGCYGLLYYEANTRSNICKRSRGIDIEPGITLLVQENERLQQNVGHLQEDNINMQNEIARLKQELEKFDTARKNGLTIY